MGILLPFVGSRCVYIAPWDFRLGLTTISCPEGSVGGFRLEGCVIGKHPDRATNLLCVGDGVSVYKVVLPHARRISAEQQLHPAAFV